MVKPLLGLCTLNQLFCVQQRTIEKIHYLNTLIFCQTVLSDLRHQLNIICASVWVSLSELVILQILLIGADHDDYMPILKVLYTERVLIDRSNFLQNDWIDPGAFGNKIDGNDPPPWDEKEIGKYCETTYSLQSILFVVVAWY